MGQLPPRGEERVLRGVVRIVRAEDRGRQPVRVRRVVVDKRGERIDVALLRARNKVPQNAPPALSTGPDVHMGTGCSLGGQLSRNRTPCGRLASGYVTPPSRLLVGQVPRADGPQAALEGILVKRLLTILAASMAVLVLAAPVAAQERGEACEDPEADPTGFICGHITVTLMDDADATIEEVIERVAPEAEVSSEPQPGGNTYLLDVPVGDEWDLVLAFRADEAVDVAHLVQIGVLTDPTPAASPMPNTATSTETPASVSRPIVALIFMLLASVAVYTTARARSSR